MTPSKKRIAQVIAVAWERDLDDNRRPLVIVHACDHELRFFDHPTKGWQVIAMSAFRAHPMRRDIESVTGAENCARALPHVLGAPLDWGRAGIALAKIADDLYEHGWRGAGELWQSRRVDLPLLLNVPSDDRTPVSA